MRPIRLAPLLLLVLSTASCIGDSNETYAAEVRARAQVVGEAIDRAFVDATNDTDPLRASKRIERLSRMSHQLEAVETSASRATKSWDFSALDRASATLDRMESELGLAPR